jgi:hypothetical protein
MAALVLQEHPEPCHAGNEWQASSPLAVPFRQTYPSELLQRLQSFLRGLLQASLLNCPPRPVQTTPPIRGARCLPKGLKARSLAYTLFWDAQTVALGCLLVEFRLRVLPTGHQTTDSLDCCSQTHSLFQSSPVRPARPPPKPVCTKDSAALSNFRQGY